jgi:predicted site-specific integrase-resolvase
LEEVMADLKALLASFSGWIYYPRSKRNQQRLLEAARKRLRR